MFAPGKNIAIKLPTRVYEETVTFYRDTIGLKVLKSDNDNTVFDYGGIRLHLDREPQRSQPEVWLEIEAEDTVAAADRFEEANVPICNEVEPLPIGFDGFWIASPAGTIHLVAGRESE
jgi:catechol 2,3-dioxygenase-like lactoylglutathione lyase family enzyme